MNDSFVSVRFEGGIGDHILGMRVLQFVRDRYPQHDVIAFSDAHAFTAQREIVALSPIISRVVPVFHPRQPDVATNSERLDTIMLEMLRQIRQGVAVIDAFGGDMFLEASRQLDVPIFDVLAARPELQVQQLGRQAAEAFLASFDDDAIVVGMHLAKFGPKMLSRIETQVMYMLNRLLSHPKTIVLNMFTSSYDYAHWPESKRQARLSRSADEAMYLQSFGRLADRVVPCVDLPIQSVVALLSRCRYFIGLDSGIKHIAWALGVPLTYFHPIRPELMQLLRWMPDPHRLLPFDCTKALLEKHIADAENAISRAQARD